MVKTISAFWMLAAAVAASGSTALADDEARQLFEAAVPQMYHTCNSLIELADGDEAVAIDVLGKIATVSVYMRQINIETLDLTDAEAEEVEDRFYLAISEGCAEDPNALLAGIVDDAVKAAFGI